MRVTQNTNFNTVRDSMHRSKGRMEKLQHEASTLKKLNLPSEDPVGSAKVLEIRTDKVNNEQFFRTAKMAEAFLNHSDHAIEDMSDVVVRAKEIAIGQSSGASSTAETRLGVAEEVTQLYQRAVAAANTRVGDRYLFGGYQTDQAPIDTDGKYVGDDGQMMVEVGKEVFLSINVPGIDAFNTNPTHSNDGKKLYGTEESDIARSPSAEILSKSGEQNVNLFKELQNLRISLLTGDLEGIRNTLDSFDQLHAHLVATRSKIGSRVAGLQSTLKTLDRHNNTNAQLSQELEDADVSQVMSDLAREETIFNSVLSSSKRLVLPTLMDFLK